eukprot:TRINITY_DN5038_c0_g1_i1.p1 TRINITY_DN5038_c0_g1~~TRINITY_DN5038_c0_g1_i1.p1  ORF type:complete len:268 (+),score=103.97 TRINITY_DN5038_c0_g1_i1:107-805(+)
MALPKPKLYLHPVCPFAHRAYWAAHEKQVDFETIEIPLGDKKPEWYTKEVNPRGTVPTLRVGDHTVFESNIIAEFFEDAYPNQGTQLLPSDPFQRASIRLFVDVFSGLVGPLYGLLKNQDRSKDEEFQQAIRAKLKVVVENLVAQSAEGPFFLGEKFSLAEILTFPFIERFSATLKFYRQFDLLQAAAELDPKGRFQKWVEASRNREAFQKTTRPAEFFIEGYNHYANPKKE